MKNIIIVIVIVVISFILCAFSKVKAYQWFDEERTIEDRFFIHLNLQDGDKLSPIVLPYNTYFRTEEIPSGAKVEIYKSPKSWEDISWDLSQGEIVSVVTSDQVCPLLEKGEYIFKTINVSSAEEVTYVFGPKKPKDELAPI